MGIVEAIRKQRLHDKALRIAKWWLIGTSIAQAITIIIITLIDQIRKLRITDPIGYPSLPPQKVPMVPSKATVYTNGKQLYTDMLRAIYRSHHYIFFETYIWKNDAVGKAFKKALIEAAERGVEVFIVYDQFANLVVSPKFYRFPKNPHLHVHPYPLLRWSLFPLSPRRIARDHRKLLVCDGDIAFVGGYNIGSLYAQQWRDTQVSIQGETVWEVENAFVDFWNAFRRKRKDPLLPDRGAKRWDSRITAALNVPHKLLFPVRGLYIDALERATKNVWITSAYFIPDKEILTAMIAASKRGVDVKVLIPEVSNHVIADWVSSSYFQDMLDAGVELWLYQDAMIHSKTATVDGRWSTIGTANIDRLSMTGNYEINLQFHSQPLAQTMENIFRKDLSNARQLTSAEWDKRWLPSRVAERLLQPFAILI